MILSELIFGKQPNWKTVTRIGIQGITVDDIEKAQFEGKRICHIATVSMEKGTDRAKVEPTAIQENHPLYSVEGVDNAIHLQTVLIGSLTLQGPGAGSLPTANAKVDAFCLLQMTL